MKKGIMKFASKLRVPESGLCFLFYEEGKRDQTCSAEGENDVSCLLWRAESQSKVLCRVSALFELFLKRI